MSVAKAARAACLGLLCSATPALHAAAAGCLPFTDDVKSGVTAYVRKLVRMKAEIPLHLTLSEPEGESCYRKLEFTVDGQSAKYLLYLSPDQRYLMPQLFDSRVDPGQAEAQEAARTDERLNAHAVQNHNPVLGEADAPVTIAVFSDFQCPYCRSEMEVLANEVAPALRERVRLVWFHFPLPSHDWARQAAEAAACAPTPEQFWGTVRFLFDHQAEMDAGRVAENIASHLGMGPGSGAEHTGPFQSCVRDRQAADSVDSDYALGQALNITATPTIFIKGRRLTGVKTAAQIREVVETVSISTK